MDTPTNTNQENTQQTFEQWLHHGYTQGWISPPVCYIHDGLPMSDQEADQLDEGDDPCIHIIRLYENPQHKQQVEQNNPPSQWRATNRWH
jgi:hypothetical protein